MKAVILAAGIGSRLGISNVPKALVQINGKCLIQYSLDNLKKIGISEIVIVIGFMGNLVKEKIGTHYEGMSIKYVENEDYSTTGSMYSLSKTENLIDDDIILLDADILYDGNVLQKLIDSSFENVMVATPAVGSRGDMHIFTDIQNNLVSLGKNIANKQNAIGEIVGITKLSLNFLKLMYVTAKENYLKSQIKQHYEESILETSKKGHHVQCMFMEKFVWTDIDTKEDMTRMREEIFPKLEEINN